MTAKDMNEIVSKRQDKMNLAQSKCNFLYDKTVAMLYALEQGKDKDACFSYWVTLIDKMEGFSRAERDYYSAHATGLVHLIEDYMKGGTE